MTSPRAPAFDELVERFLYHPDEDVGRFLEMAPEVAPSAPAQPAEPDREFLSFRLDGETWAVPIEGVREVMKVPPLTEVPRGDKHLVGLMNVRGEMLPVYDIKPRLGLTAMARAAPWPRGTRVVLLRDELGDAGILVDEVPGVVRLSPARLEQAPSFGRELACVAGLGKGRGELFILLDVQQALA